MATKQTKPKEVKKVPVQAEGKKPEVKPEAKPKAEKKPAKKTESKSQARRKAVQKKAAKKDVVRPNVTHQPPAGASQEDITPRVVKEPKETFEQRTTGNNQPWLNADGTQNNG